MSEAFKRNLKDAETIKSFACPSSASSNTTSAIVDVAGSDTGNPPEMLELELECPALSTTIVPDTRTVTYSIEVSTTSDFSSDVLVVATETKTGTDSGGVAAADIRGRMPSTYRYARGKVAFGASTTTGAAVSAEFALLY